MSEEENPFSKQDQLAYAIARGNSITQWARLNQVPRSTAYYWAKDPDVRRLVEECRRRSLDRVLGCMARESMRAFKRIARLGETAESESVQLRASQAVLHDQIAVSKFSNMEYRVGQLEEKQRARTGLANRQA